MQHQSNTKTAPARHIPLLKALASELSTAGFKEPRVLSFGCSVGYELLDIANTIPNARVKGCDINQNALERARALSEPVGIHVFTSSPDTLVDEGPFEAVTAFNVFCCYPICETVANLSEYYKFETFDNGLKALDRCLAVGGYIALYNANYFFEQAGISGRYAAIAPPTNEAGETTRENGWASRFDRDGRLVASLCVTHEGRVALARSWRMETPNWKEIVQESRQAMDAGQFDAARHPVFHYEVVRGETLDLQTFLWRKVSDELS